MNYSLYQCDSQGNIRFEKYEGIDNDQLVYIHNREIEMNDRFAESEDEELISQNLDDYILILNAFENNPSSIKILNNFKNKHKESILKLFLQEECYNAAAELQKLITNGKS